ncbi:MAG: undecaprenyl-diphosphate phosphatase [Rhodobacteraceae bacterium]|nr:undecaprenyl-diphosphate phosphatase [Paracoccaceae bacterium]
MSLFQLFLVALIQGLTEFLPISSSGHLILLPALTELDDQGQVIDVAVHIGTLGAVILYFRSDMCTAAAGSLRLFRGRVDTRGAVLALCLVVATVPVILFGLFVYLMGWGDAMRSVTVIGWTMLIFGLVLYWADQTGPVTRKAEGWTPKHALIMGLWQAIALLPGVSRSGITITAGRYLGYDRESATRLAMLMSIPAIIASGGLLWGEVIATADARTARNGVIAAVFAFLAALAALAFMMRLLRRVSFTPYVIYRVILGVILLVIAYG